MEFLETSKTVDKLWITLIDPIVAWITNFVQLSYKQSVVVKRCTFYTV